MSSIERSLPASQATAAFADVLAAARGSDWTGVGRSEGESTLQVIVCRTRALANDVETK